MRSAAPLLLATLIALFPNGVFAQNTLSLKYGTPKKQPLRYKILTVEKVSQLDHDGLAKRIHSRNEKVIAQRVRRHRSGHYVQMKILRSRLNINGQDIAQDFKGGTFKGFRSYRGRFGNAKGKVIPAWNRLGLIFPRRPLRIGEAWKVTDPPTRSFPIPVTTTYVLEGIRPVDGRTCAVITGSTRVDETLSQRGVTLRIITRSKIYFDVSDGVLVRSKSRTRYNLLCPENNAMALKRMVKDVQVRVELRK